MRCRDVHPRRVFLATSAVALATWALMTASGCGPAYPKCDNDEQCRKDKSGKAIVEYCLFGQCAQCAKDENCAAGEHCNKGRCDKSCADDTQCGAGQICNAGSCGPAECSDAKPCGGGMSCTAGRCAAPKSSSAAAPAPAAVVACDHKQTVHFDFNLAELRPDARAVLDNLPKCFEQDKSWALTIEGHCDERGTTEYNLALGDKRARAAYDYLRSLGVAAERMRTTSYGKEKPLDPSHNEGAWAKNRRDHFNVTH
jgi:peptidoglycan-associated lipoprotein